VAQRIRSWIIGAVLIALGVLVGQILPRSSVAPKSESGTVISVNPNGPAAGFSFKPKGKGTKNQNFRLVEAPTPWQVSPGGAWRSQGQPGCLVSGSSQPRRATLGVVTVQAVGSAPASTLVVWVECGS
jgi:hypothetical protein